MKNFNLIEWLQTDSHEKQRVSSMRRYAAMLLLLLITCAHAWGATTAPTGGPHTPGAIAAGNLVSANGRKYEVFFSNNASQSSLLVGSNTSATTVSTSTSGWCNIGSSCGNNNNNISTAFTLQEFVSNVKGNNKNKAIRVQGINQSEKCVVMVVSGYDSINVLDKGEVKVWGEVWNGSSYNSAAQITASKSTSASSHNKRHVALDATKQYRLTLTYGATGSTNKDLVAFSLCLPQYNVSHNLTNVSKSSGDNAGTKAATAGVAVNTVFAAADGYTLPSTITVTIGGVTQTAGTGYTWNSSTGAFQVPAAKVTGAIVVTITGEAASSCSDDTGLSYGETTVNKTYGDAVFTNTLTNSNSLSVTYSSTNTSVATVNSSTGAVTIKAAGTTTIKATWAGNATYCEDEVSYTLNVKPAVGSVSGAWDRFGGETISLSVTPSGGSSYSYQWKKWYNDQWNNVSNGTVSGSETSGATTNNLQITNCTKDHSGSYCCEVTSAGQTNETDGYQVKVFVLECYTGGTTVYNFTRDGNNQRGSVTIDLDASTAYKFKVHADNDYYGNNGTIDEDETNWVLCNNDNDYCNPNLTVNSGLGGTFTFTMDYSAEGNSDQVGEPELSVTYPRKRIYLEPNSDWLSNSAKFAYYYWRDGGSSAWTDFLTSDDCGRYADIPQWNGVKVIAGRINGDLDAPAFGDNKCWNQTSDLTVTSDDYIEITGWNSSQNYNSTYAAPTYTISYNKGTSGSGTKSDETKTCGMAFTLPSSAVFTRTGYTQTGWTTSDGGAQEYALGGTYTTNEDKTFYPVWTVNNYNLTWNLGGGTTTSAGTGIASGVSVNTTSSVAYGTSLTAPTVTKTYYTFSAWSPSVAETMPASNTTYTATFTANTYSVTHTLSGVTTSSGSTGAGAATYGTNYTARFAASSGYELPSSVTVTAGGSDITANCTYTKGTGTVVIPGSYITGNIVITVTGTYAANFQMIANSSAASELTLSSGDTIKQGEKNCSTLTGGVAVYRNGTNTMKVQKGTPYGWYFGSNGDSIVITMTSNIIKVGSIITVSGHAGASGCGFTFNGSTSITKSDGSSGDMTDSTYTVKAGDSHLIGKNVIVVKRASGSATRLYSLKLSNCQSGTMCVTPVLPSLTTPNSGCTTSDFATWNATVTNAPAISAASGSQSVSYSWKNSSSVEVATTASYKPSAAGTYTVTATVHSDASGYIDAKATSSTLTASLYGNPSVTGPSDAEYEVGDNATNLSVTATPTHGEILTYQWYRNTAKSTSSPTPTALANCTTSTYKPSTAAAATTYYFCKISGGCAAVYSDIATVTVSEAPDFKFKVGKTKAGSGWDVANNGAITTSLWTDGSQVLTGGTLTNTSGSALGCNATYGLVYAASGSKQVTVAITGGKVLSSGSVITIVGYSDNTTNACGFKISGNNMSPATYTPGSAAYTKFTQTYTVTGGSALDGSSSFTIDQANSTRVYLNSITVTGCVECTPITPSLTPSSKTLYAYGGTPRQVALALSGNTGSGAVTWRSSDENVVTVNSSGVVTAVGAGTATVTATIAASGDYCGAVKTATLTVPSLVQQTINVGSDKTWNTVPDMTFPGDPTSTLTKNTNIANNGYTFDATANGSADRGGMTAKFTGIPSATSKDDEKYLSLKFNTPSYNIRLSDVIVPIQPVTNAASAIATLSDGTTTITSSEVANIPAGAVKQAKFTFTPTVFAAGSTITMKVYIYNQTGDKGFRLATPIMVNGSVLKDQKFTTAGNWSTPSNWDSGSLPEIYHDVVIEKPATVDIAHATAKSVVIYNNGDSKTGKLTINPNKGLEVAETVRKTTDGSSYSGTGEADLVLESSSAGNASLIFDNSNGCEATVMMYSKASISGGKWNWQYVGTPFKREIPLYNYYGGYMYKWNGTGWDVVHGTDPLEPFAGYCLTQASPTTHYMSGELIATDGNDYSVTISSADKDMVLANSWTAPIYIGAFTTEGVDATFTSTPATIYLFNTGAAEKGSEEGTEAGKFKTITVHAAPYTGDSVIAPMQGFFVTTNGGSSGTIKLKYDELVRPADSRGIVGGPMKLPKRTKAAVGKPDVMKIWANGSEYNDRVVILAREDFSEGFDNGWDGEKLSFGNASPSVYVINEEGGYDAVSAIPEYEGTLVGFRAGSEDNVYTMTFEYNGEEVLYLNDLKAQMSAEIATGQTYMFTTEDGDSEVRFIISHNPIRRITTGVDDVETGTKARKVLINDKIYIIRKGRVYSVDGQIVK